MKQQKPAQNTKQGQQQATQQASQQQATQQASQQQATQQASQQQATLPLRELGVSEIVALAVHRKRVQEKRGKTSRRVVLHLSPWQIPPRSGVYSSWLGEVKIFSSFRVEEGKWLVEVSLPKEGFAIKDYQQPSPSQPSDKQ